MENEKATPARKNRNTVFLGLAVRERGPSGRWRIRFLWARVFTLMLVTAIGAYCLMVTGFYFYFKNVKDFKEVKYWDMYTLLFNREEHRAKMGDYQVEEAKVALENGDFHKALIYLRTGVQRSPSNLEGRSLLADFFQFGYRPARTDDAIEILRDGLPYAYENPDYIKKYVQMLLLSQEDKEVIKVADRILKTDPNKEVTRILAMAAATANYYRGNFDAAEDYLKRYDLDKDMEGALLSARISWDRGQQEAALAKLSADLNEFSNKEPFYELMTRFYREMGDNAKARQYAVLRNINAPLNVAPRIDLLFILDSTGQGDRARMEAESILQQFSNDERSLQYLSNFATETGQVELSRRIYERALENDFNIAPFAMLLIESHIAAGDYKGAIDFTTELVKERPDWLEKNWPIFNSLRSVAYYGLGNQDLTELYLGQFLQSSDIRGESLLAVSKRFEELNGMNQARKVLLQAVNQNPKNQAALSRLIRIEIELGNSAELGPHLEKLLQMRRPSTQILTEAYRKLGSDRFIFTRGRQDLLIELEALIGSNVKTGEETNPS